MQTATKTIYMADGDEAVVDATLMILQHLGYAVGHTLDASKITDLLRSKPDLLILDTFELGNNDCAVCRGIKDDPANSGIHILLVSAGKHTLQWAIATGADAFLSKPFEMNELIHKIDELMYME